MVLWPNGKSLWVHRELLLVLFDYFPNPSILLVCHKMPWKLLCRHHSSRHLKLALSLTAWILVQSCRSVQLPNNVPKIKIKKSQVATTLNVCMIILHCYPNYQQWGSFAATWPDWMPLPKWCHREAAWPQNLY